MTDSGGPTQLTGRDSNQGHPHVAKEMIVKVRQAMDRLLSLIGRDKPGEDLAQYRSVHVWTSFDLRSLGKSAVAAAVDVC